MVERAFIKKERYIGNSCITSTREVSGLNCDARGRSDLNRIHPE